MSRSQSSEQKADSLADLVEEITDLLHAGATIDWQSYYDRHPARAEELRQLLPGLAMLTQAGSAPAGPASALGDYESQHHLPGVLGDFRLGRELGRGGMGVVYEAEQLSLRRRVALKILPFAAVLDPRHLQRFKNEAQAAAHLHHQHIVPVYGVGCERGIHYYAMQYIEGQSLAGIIDELARQKNTPKNASPAASTRPDAALFTACSMHGREHYRLTAQLGIQAAEALDHAHELGVVHRDIKPANLLVDVGGNLWIADFGLAQFQADQNLTLTGHLVGTLRYMSPEQTLGRRTPIDHRTDIYSLGATLYELLTLRPAFPGNDRQELLGHIAEVEPAWPRHLSSAVPRELETIVMKAMAKLPTQRYATAHDLAEDLRSFLEDRPIQARRPSPWHRTAKWARRHRVLVVAGLAFCLVMAIALAVSAVFIGREHEAALRRDEAEAGAARLVERELSVIGNFYREDIINARKAWEGGDINEMRHLLGRYREAHPAENLRSQVRGFEWYYLWWLCHGGQRLEATLAGHEGEVYGVAFSPDGQLLASAGQDRTVRLWNMGAKRLHKILAGHTSDVNGVAFSPDGATLASASDDHTIKLWNVSTGIELGTLRGHREPVLCVAFSPDGKLLASGARDKTMRLWQAGTGQEDDHFLAPGEIQFLVFSRDGQTLSAACTKARVSWTLTTPRRVETLPIEPAYSIAYSPRGDLIATGDVQGVLRVSSRKAGDNVPIWRGQSGQVNSLSFSANGKTLLTAAADGVIRMWAVEHADLKDQWIGHEGRIWCIAVSPDGGSLATAGDDGSVRVWRLPTDRPRRDHVCLKSSSHTHARAALFIPKTRLLVTLHDWEPSLVTWDVDTGQSALFGRVESSALPCALAVTPDGSTLVVGLDDGKIQLWDVRTRHIRSQFAGHEGNIASMAISHDSRLLALTTGRQLDTRIWDLSIDPPTSSSLGDTGVLYVAFCSASAALATASPGTGTAARWDLTQKEPKRLEVSFHHQGVDNVLFSPDGKTLTTCGSDNCMRLWSVSSAAEIARQCSGNDRCTLPAFSPDGRTIVALLGNHANLFDATSLQKLSALEDGEPDFMPLAFTSDGTVMARTGMGKDSKCEIYLLLAPREER